MSLDFYRLDDEPKTIVYTLGEDTFELLSEIFQDLEKRTGVTVDPYVDTRLYKGHATIIASLISTSIMNPTKKILDFKTFLDQEIFEGHDLLILGE